MVAASSLTTNNLGQYEACSTAPGMQHCTLDDVVVTPVGKLQLVQAMCAPAVCTPGDVSEVWFLFHCVSEAPQHFLSIISPLWIDRCKHAMYKNETICSYEFTALSNQFVRFAQTVVNKTGFIQEVAVHCGDHAVSVWEAGDAAMLGVCAAVLLLVALGEAVVYHDRAYAKTVEGGEALLGPSEDHSHPARSLNGDEGNEHHADDARRAHGPRRRGLLFTVLRAFSVRQNFASLLKKEGSRSLG
jgi:hypothetical protein